MSYTDPLMDEHNVGLAESLGCYDDSANWIGRGMRTETERGGEGGAAQARRRRGTGWRQVAEAPEAETDSRLAAGRTESSSRPRSVFVRWFTNLLAFLGYAFACWLLFASFMWAVQTP